MSPALFRVILPVSDLERAGAFWQTLLGLPIDTAVPTRHYIRTGGAILTLVDPVEHARGHGDSPDPFRPNPDWIYFRVPDLDGVWAKAQSLSCPPPRGHEGAGIARRDWGDRSFYTYDPFGNPICFIDDAGSDTTPEKAKYAGTGSACLANAVLPTTSLGRAEAFYEALLGVACDASIPNRRFFHLDECQLSLVDTEEHTREHGLEPEPFRPNPDLIYIAVDDLDATFERAERLKLQPARNEPAGIATHPWGERSFYGLDPSGNPICLVDDQTLYRGADDNVFVR